MSETHVKDKQIEEEEVEEEEYVLLELDHCLYSDISPGAPFVLTGLDTLTPTLTVGGLKMVGEYEESVGTCYLFSESDAESKPPSDETTPSDENTNKPAGSSNSVQGGESSRQRSKDPQISANQRRSTRSTEHIRIRTRKSETKTCSSVAAISSSTPSVYSKVSRSGSL